jgi:excisionase family DNA binding protein
MSDYEVISAKLDRIESLLVEIKNDSIDPLPKKPDRITIDEACVVLGNVSKAFMYGETHKGSIPYKKFGPRLIFSRQELLAWREARTGDPKFPSAIIDEKLVKSANKKLR